MSVGQRAPPPLRKNIEQYRERQRQAPPPSQPPPPLQSLWPPNSRRFEAARSGIPPPTLPRPALGHCPWRLPGPGAATQSGGHAAPPRLRDNGAGKWRASKARRAQPPQPLPAARVAVVQWRRGEGQRCAHTPSASMRAASSAWWSCLAACRGTQHTTRRALNGGPHRRLQLCAPPNCRQGTTPGIGQKQKKEEKACLGGRPPPPRLLHHPHLQLCFQFTNN